MAKKRNNTRMETFAFFDFTGQDDLLDLQWEMKLLISIEQKMSLLHIIKFSSVCQNYGWR
jgi:hypothetical protein